MILTETDASSCPFCREPVPNAQEEREKQLKKRIEANDPVAICKWGVEQYNKGDYHKAFECYAKAADLGDVFAENGLRMLDLAEQQAAQANPNP